MQMRTLICFEGVIKTSNYLNIAMCYGNVIAICFCV